MLKLPTAKEFLAKVWQLGDASMVLSSGLGRLMVRSDMMGDIDIGTTDDDDLFFVDPSGTGIISKTEHGVTREDLMDTDDEHDDEENLNVTTNNSNSSDEYTKPLP